MTMAVIVRGIGYFRWDLESSFISKGYVLSGGGFHSKDTCGYLFFGRILMMIRWYLVRAGEPLSVTAKIK